MWLFAVEGEQERGKLEAAEWKKLVVQAEAAGGQARIAELEPQLQEVRDDVQDMQVKLDASSLAAFESILAEKKDTALRNIQAEVELRAKNTQYEHFQGELDAGKGLREELMKSLERMLKLLFLPSWFRRGWLSESMAGISASHALVVVKSHYPRVNLAAVEEGYPADCSEEDVDRRLGEVAPLVAALVKDLGL
uniref:Uncharacterized protein n=1 Tax=Oryza punctata TaxID=4537 RepID=A0A0E0JYS1_ORYPU